MIVIENAYYPPKTRSLSRATCFLALIPGSILTNQGKSRVSDSSVIAK